MSDVDGLLCIGLLEDDADFREELALGLGGFPIRRQASRKRTLAVFQIA